MEAVKQKRERLKHEDIVLSPFETVIRSYQCSQLRFPKCKGTLTVTDKRVLFHGSASESRIVNEVQINTVSGISSYFGGKLNVWLLAGAIAATLTALGLLISSIGMMSTGARYYNRGYGNNSLGAIGFFIFLLAAGVGTGAGFMYRYCYQKAFYLNIFSSQATGSPIEVGNRSAGLLGNFASLALIANPTNDTSRMMLELGALIADIQEDREQALIDWK